MAKAFVKMRTGNDARELAMTRLNAGDAAGVDYQSKTRPDVLTVNLPAGDLAALRDSGAQVYADIEFEPLGPSRPQRVQRGRDDLNRAVEPEAMTMAGATGLDDVLDQIRARESWTVSRGRGVTIVIVDTGVCGTLREFPTAKRSTIDLPTAYSAPHRRRAGAGSMASRRTQRSCRRARR